MNNYGRIQAGDAVEYRLPDNTCLYGLVESVRFSNARASERDRTVVARVAFPVTDESLAPVRADCDQRLLSPLADPELRAFLAANTGLQWSRPHYAVAIDSALRLLRAAPRQERKRG